MSDIDRKSLKRPDQLLRVLQSFFQGLAQNSRQLMAVVIGSIVLFAVVFGYISYKQKHLEDGREALYGARLVLEKEQVAKKDLGSFAKIDVAGTYPEALKELEAVASEYSGSRPGFEASLVLGNLYYDHGDAAKAKDWFEKASKDAPGKLEKALSLSSLGYAFENTNQLKEAVTSYDRALKQGEPSVKGDLLLALARVHEALGESAKAKSYYDRITSELPKTSYARKAGILRASLQ